MLQLPMSTLFLQGASCVLYRSNEIRKYQIFTYATWPGGLFGSPSMAGTRPGGNLASSWAAIMSLGQNGYLNVAKELMNVTSYLIRSIKEMEVRTATWCPVTLN